MPIREIPLEITVKVKADDSVIELYNTIATMILTAAESAAFLASYCTLVQHNVISTSVPEAVHSCCCHCLNNAFSPLLQKNGHVATKGL